MEYKREKDFQQKATYDTFDAIYTSFDLSVNEKYDAGQGYPFDYPLQWLRDASMNKRIAIRRLTFTPSSHAIRLELISTLGSTSSSKSILIPNNIEITNADNLVKVLAGMSMKFSMDIEEYNYHLWYNYDSNTNHLNLAFSDNIFSYHFQFKDPDEYQGDDGNPVYPNIDELLKFLNQDLTNENRNILLNPSVSKEFNEVWNRDEVFFHASFFTSKSKFIGISGDFYMTHTVLYPPPTNESTFYIRTTTNGSKNILIRHCVFMVQLVFIVNFMKTKILQSYSLFICSSSLSSPGYTTAFPEQGLQITIYFPTLISTLVFLSILSLY